jgi:hypothetical protein
VFALADDPPGVTTALSAVAGLTALPFTGADAVWHDSYWAQMVPSLSYGAIFLPGIILGAFAAVAAWQFHVETVPATRRGGASATHYRFGSLPPLRAARWTAAGASDRHHDVTPISSLALAKLACTNICSLGPFRRTP